jgi:NAD(P)-dependent dehydrogenase (short-subunit alcohol dehydrogenase family)
MPWFAGIVKTAPFLEMSEADFDAVLSVNLKVSSDCWVHVHASGCCAI